MRKAPGSLKLEKEKKRDENYKQIILYSLSQFVLKRRGRAILK